MDDKEWDLYHKVKEELGLKSDAELFRYLVRYYFRREMRE